MNPGSSPEFDAGRHLPAFWRAFGEKMPGAARLENA
jgi:hypothetical protein